MSELTGSNHRCRAQFKCTHTVIGQRSAGNGPNGLPYDYYYYYYYYSISSNNGHTTLITLPRSRFNDMATAFLTPEDGTTDNIVEPPA